MPHPYQGRIPGRARGAEGIVHDLGADGAVPRVDIFPLCRDRTAGGVVVREVVPVPGPEQTQDGLPHCRPLRGVRADSLEAVVHQVQHGEDHGGCEWGVGEGEDVAADAAVKLAEGWWLEEAGEVG